MLAKIIQEVINMSEKRIIPCLDIENGRVVKGINFTDLVDAGDPVEIAKAYELQGADELVLLDIKATDENRKTTLDIVEKIAKEISIPLIVGGGIKTVDDFKMALESGASKVSIGSAAVFTPDIITECSGAFGSDKVVVAMDVKYYKDDTYHLYVKGGKENTAIDPAIWSGVVAGLGAGEILLTSMDRDGTKEGYDIDIVKIVRSISKLPIIASGGAGKMEDFYDVFKEGRASGALAASLFHFGEVDIRELKGYLDGRGIPVRKAGL